VVCPIESLYTGIRLRVTAADSGPATVTVSEAK
jgi:hypothetical protein